MWDECGHASKENRLPKSDGFIKQTNVIIWTWTDALFLWCPLENVVNPITNHLPLRSIYIGFLYMFVKVRSIQQQFHTISTCGFAWKWGTPPILVVSSLTSFSPCFLDIAMAEGRLVPAREVPWLEHLSCDGDMKIISKFDPKNIKKP